MEIDAYKQDRDSENDSSHMPPYRTPVEKEGSEEEICRNDCYIDENIYESKEGEKHRSWEDFPGNDEVDSRKYISSGEFVYDVVIDGKYRMKYYFQDSAYGCKGFHEKRVDEEIGETGTERLEYDRHKRHDEDILESESLKCSVYPICQTSEEKRVHRYFPEYKSVIYSSFLCYRCHIGLKIGNNWTIFP